MYKYRKLLLACSLLPMLAACNSAPEYHELTPVVEPAILFADQKLDSIRFFTYDNWSATPQQDWLGIAGPSRQDNVQYDYRRSILYRVLVSAQPNTTGKTRIGTVLVHSYEYDSLFPIMQLGILNVSHPQYKADSWIDDSQFYPEVAHFELTDSAYRTADSICFTVENNWELTFADATPPDWLTLDLQTGMPRRHYQVNLTLTPNSGEERKATLRLTSGEVTNEIVVRQLAPEKEE